MESALDPVLGAAFPVFALIACGVLAGRFRLITPGSSEALNRFVYTFALPAMLFVAVYRGSLDELLGSGSFLLGVVRDHVPARGSLSADASRRATCSAWRPVPSAI
jgi:hypothetical protein